MQSRGLTPKVEQFDTSGSKATKVEDMFQWLTNQERLSKKKFESYDQVTTIREKFEKLGMVAKMKAQREGMKWP